MSRSADDSDQNTRKHDPKNHLPRAVAVFALYTLGVPALLFICAGTLVWPMAWTYVGLSLAAMLGTRLLLLRLQPELLRERARSTRAAGTQQWDKLLMPIVALYGPAVVLVVAGLNRRFGWTSAIPTVGQYAAAVAIAAAYALAAWAMLANRYFSAVARIQTDRGQVVVSDGPYRLVRHPAYAGGLLAGVATPVMLDALPALIPALIVAAAVFVRTGLEDLMLRRELAGYSEYCSRTRYRLIPGIW